MRLPTVTGPVGGEWLWPFSVPRPAVGLDSIAPEQVGELEYLSSGAVFGWRWAGSTSSLAGTTSEYVPGASTDRTQLIERCRSLWMRIVWESVRPDVQCVDDNGVGLGIQVVVVTKAWKAQR